MTNTPPIVTIFGGSGFVGRYISHRMARAGWRVRVAVRRPNEALYVKPYGDVGQVEPILCNVRNKQSVREAVAGADAVVNCVGILQATKFQNFGDVHVDAAARVARMAAEAGVSKLVHISALHADEESDSAYAVSKAKGEAHVKQAFPSAVILRPAVIFGSEDNFFNRMATFNRISPFVPLVSADTKYQPVYVDDVAAAAEAVITGDVEGGVYELGGPEIATLRDLAKMTGEALSRRCIPINTPAPIARFEAWGLEMLAKVTGGLFPAMITRDQLKLLAVDNVVSEGSKGFSELGITPTAIQSVLSGYVYSYRVNGQFTAMSSSAKNLKS